MTDETVLVMTVGTGDINHLEQTLIVPLANSFRHGEWCEAVLLPSLETKAYAFQIRKRLGDVPVRIEPLPEAGMENDADKCFGHFDDVIAGLLNEGIAPGSIGIDFTRGTKAMSAALVLAAAAREIPSLRYVKGKRDARGIVVAGTEDIYSFQTTLVSDRWSLRLAANLFRRGDYAAVLDVLSERIDSSSNNKYQAEAASLRRRAEFMAAWERLDYERALDKSRQLKSGDVPEEWVSWVRSLTHIPKDSDYAGQGLRLKRVAWDLLYNGKRRLDERRFEDAFIRAYRVLELIGQFLLFERGMDSSRLDREHPEVKKLQSKLKKNKSKSLDQGRSGYLQAGRYQVAKLLKQMNDPMAGPLMELATSGGLNKRNQSILAHGFKAEAPPEAHLIQRYAELEGILVECGTVDGWAELLGSLQDNPSQSP